MGCSSDLFVLKIWSNPVFLFDIIHENLKCKAIFLNNNKNNNKIAFVIFTILKEFCIDDFLIFINNKANINSKI